MRAHHENGRILMSGPSPSRRLGIYIIKAGTEEEAARIALGATRSRWRATPPTNRTFARSLGLDPSRVALKAQSVPGYAAEHLVVSRNRCVAATTDRCGYLLRQLIARRTHVAPRPSRCPAVVHEHFHRICTPLVISHPRGRRASGSPRDHGYPWHGQDAWHGACPSCPVDRPRTPPGAQCGDR